MKNEKILWMSRISIVAALYVALTVISHPFSYDLVQFRISEALMILVCFDKRYTWSMVIGCLISNIFSFNIIDCLFGTLATLLACITMILVKNRFAASFAPAIFNGVIVGLELHIILQYPLIYAAVSVAFGELVIVVILGNILANVINKNKALMEIIGIKSLMNK